MRRAPSTTKPGPWRSLSLSYINTDILLQLAQAAVAQLSGQLRVAVLAAEGLQAANASVLELSQVRRPMLAVCGVGRGLCSRCSSQAFIEN
jgi:hypothetical protein